MIVGIYSEKHDDSNYYLTLDESRDSFALKVVDKDGNWLTTILRVGKGHGSCITLNADVRTELGLKLDKNGHVVTEMEVS